MWRPAALKNYLQRRRRVLVRRPQRPRRRFDRVRFAVAPSDHDVERIPLDGLTNSPAWLAREALQIERVRFDEKWDEQMRNLHRVTTATTDLTAGNLPAGTYRVIILGRSQATTRIATEIASTADW